MLFKRPVRNENVPLKVRPPWNRPIGICLASNRVYVSTSANLRYQMVAIKECCCVIRNVK